MNIILIVYGAIFILSYFEYVDGHRELCEKEIELGVDVENVAWLFEIADKHRATQLKDFCFYFLIKHFEAVRKTEAFANLGQDALAQIRHRRDVPLTLAPPTPTSTSTSTSTSSASGDMNTGSTKEKGTCIVQ
jgi:hypothetical protein